MGVSQPTGSGVERIRGSTVPTRIVVRLLIFYQYLAGGRPPVCRYVPSCSNYALDAFQRHGTIQGLWLSAKRLVRCNPWGKKGWDPVPSSAGRASSKDNF